jgi:Protein of unknown function (DUF1566)
MRAALWSIVVGGLIGAMLWVGPVGAQPFPGGLPACVGQLNTCNANLQTCQTDLAACLAEPTVIFPGDGLDGPALSYKDNGNGTATDNNTQLVWEIKQPTGGVHNVDNTYTWDVASTVFLDTLNNTCDGDETRACTSDAACGGIGSGKCGYAGYRDWRLPTAKELHWLFRYSVSANIQAHFRPIPHESSLYAMDYRHVCGIVVVLSKDALSQRFGDASATLFPGLPWRTASTSTTMASSSLTPVHLRQRRPRLGQPERHGHGTVQPDGRE